VQRLWSGEVQLASRVSRVTATANAAMSWYEDESWGKWEDVARQSGSSSAGWSPTGPGAGSASAAAPRAASEGPGAPASEPARHCFGDVGCPWCMFDFSPGDHHDLRKLGERVQYMKFGSTMGEDKHPKPMSPIMHKIFWTVAEACVAHTELAFPTMNISESKESLVVLGVLPPPTCAGAVGSAWMPGMVPGPPPTSSWPPEDEMEAGCGKKKKPRNKKFDWEADAAWRNDPKLPADPLRQRGIKIKINEDPGYTWVEGDALQTLLQFYDNANLKDVCERVEVSPGRIYDYRFEGGNWMSQSNPSYPDRKRREVVVVYVAATAP